MYRSRSSTGAKPRILRYSRNPTQSSEFDPFIYGSPLVIAWAEDPDWSHPADGAAVTTWPSRGSVVGSFDQMVAAPLYDADGAGGKPSISYNGTTMGLAFSAALNQAAPYTLVFVASIANDPGIPVVVNGAGGSGVLGGYWTAGDGTVNIPGSLSDTALHVWEVRMVDGNDTNVLLLDGAQDSTGTGTPDNLTSLALGDFLATLYAQAQVPFIAAYPAATSPAGLVDRLVTHYGT